MKKSVRNNAWEIFDEKSVKKNPWQNSDGHFPRKIFDELQKIRQLKFPTTIFPTDFYSTEIYS